MSDTLGNARWASGATLGLGGGAGTNPNNCTPAPKTVNGHTYYIPDTLVNGNGTFVSTMVGTTNGNIKYMQQFICDMGILKTVGSEISEVFCNNGYISNGLTCVSPSAGLGTNCMPKPMMVNNHNYDVPAIAHNFTKTAYTSVTIPNGTQNYKQLFLCTNGTITPTGNEEFISNTCIAGYAWNGSACVQSNNTEVIEAFSGTTCNTANIRVESVAPGSNTLSQTLKPDTLYKLQPGTYEISTATTMSSCSAIVGAGTDATTIQYGGAVYGSDDLIKSSSSNVVISKVKLLGTKQGSQARVANVVNLVGASNNLIKNAMLRQVDIQSATNAGVNMNYTTNSILDGVKVADVSSNNSSYGIFLASSSNNTLTNITISHISSSSFSYGISLSSSSSYNTLTNITISNISSSSSSYGISLSPPPPITPLPI